MPTSRASGRALAANRRLQIELELVNGPPARLDPAVEVITYTVVIDVDGDGQPDFRLLYGNDVDGQTGFRRVAREPSHGRGRVRATVPGLGRRSADSTITFRSDGPRWGRRAPTPWPRPWSASTTPVAGATRRWTNSVDHAPDQQWPRPNPRWVEVGGV